MQNRLALVSVVAFAAAGAAFVACGGDTTTGFTTVDAGPGSELDATRMLGGDDDAAPSGNDQDATTSNGDDDSGNPGNGGQDASGDDDTNDASSGSNDAAGGNDAAMDAGSATDASDASRALDASDASDAQDAADAGDADAGTLATFLTPTCDGMIGTNEYGPNVEGEDSYTVSAGGTTWRATWNDTALYLAISTANTSEAAVVYLDVNGAAGTNVGYDNYDNSDPSALPFGADAVTYAKADSSNASGIYEELRASDGKNGWTGPDTSKVQICVNADTTTREIIIPWTVAGTARPSAFGFFAYVVYTNNGGGIYGQIPRTNPTGLTSAVGHFFKVANSAAGNYAFTAPQ